MKNLRIRSSLFFSLLCGVGLLCSSQLLNVKPYPNHTADVADMTTAMSAQRLPDENASRPQPNLNLIDIQKTWDITTGSSEIIIAVIDDAIEVKHPDLRDNVYLGWDFVDGDDDPSPAVCVDPATQIPIKEDHGTSVAGIIGAVGNNSLGIAGINWTVKILPIRIGCTYSGAYESQAIEYAIANGAHIINASYAGPDFIVRNNNVIQQLKDAKEDVLFVTAAGNYHTDNDVSPMYPSNVQLPNVITVASSNSNNQLSHWSQFGASSVELAAPGENLLSTLFNLGSDNDYGNVSGTSFSTAIVSGVAALIKAQDYEDGVFDLSPGDLKGILMASGTPLNGQTGLLQSDAVVNAFNALTITKERRPVVSIETINVNDAASNTANGIVDPLETFSIELALENLWDDIVSVQLELQSENSLLEPIETTRSFEFWPKNTNQMFSFRFRADDFSQHQAFAFSLLVNVTGSTGVYQQVRHFTLNAGLLRHNVPVTDSIQRNSQDELRRWHFNIPAEANNVAIEIERNTLDDRKLGLLVGIGELPTVYFRAASGVDYRTEAKFKRLYSDRQIERLDFTISTQLPETINLLLFNKPLNNTLEATIKNYQIRACYFTDNDTNNPPIVDAGFGLIVKPGESVALQGSASDSDGEVTRQWWTSASNIAFTASSATNISFIAPQSGSATFILSAVDNDCRKATDSVTIIIEEENSIEDGLQINPKRIEIEEGTSIDVQVNAFYQNNVVENLRFVSGPEGMIYNKSANQTSFDNLKWPNTAGAGIYSANFDSNIGGELIGGRIIIEIKTRGGQSAGGGCTLSKNNAFDPLFLFYLGFSLLILLKPDSSRAKKHN